MMAFRPRGRAKEEMKNIEAGLYTKSWLCHCLMTISRVIYPLMNFAYWQEGFKNREKIVNLNQDFSAEIQTPLTIVIIALLPVGVLIDVISWKHRSFAKYIIYYEAVSFLLQGFVPFEFGSVQSIFTMMMMILIYTLVVCQLSVGAIVCSVVYFTLEVIIFPIVYIDQELTLMRIANKSMNALFCFLLLSIFCMLGAYVAQLRGQMSKIIGENLGLLNRMYEGLLVLRKEDHQLEFASKPAIKILKSKPQTDDERGSHPIAKSSSVGNNETGGDILIEDTVSQQDLKRSIFQATSVSINKAGQIEDKDHQMRSREGRAQNSNEAKSTVSLESIIQTQI